jgi:predicted peptidase
MRTQLPRLPVIVIVLSTLMGRSIAPALAQNVRPPTGNITALPTGDHFEAVVMPSGDTLRYTIYVPPEMREWAPVPLVVALHYGSAAAPWIGGAYLHQLVKPALEELGAILVAPDALAVPEASYRTEGWTSARNEEAVVWLTRQLMVAYPVEARKIVLTGYSAGGAGVWMLAEKHPGLFSAALSVSGSLPYQQLPEVKIPVQVIHSWNDEVISAILVQGAVEQMNAAGADIDLRIISGVTHYQTSSFIEPLHDALPWLSSKWDQHR